MDSKHEEKEKQKLADLVELLGSIKGRHTELVTVMIPAGANIFPVVRQLEAERSTAENIKSKQTRSAVVDSIETILRELKNYRQTPKNGLALFAGNVSTREGSQDIQIWAIEPYKPLNVRIYRCDQTFVLDPLKEMLEVQEVYGLLVIDRQQATIGLLEGKNIKVLQKLTSGVPGKVRAGGQCLSPDTEVLMADGKKKPISKIKIGDKVIAMKDVHNYTISKVIDKWSKTKDSVFEIITKNSKIICSKDHQFFARRRDCLDWWAAEELSESDELSEPMSNVEETGSIKINEIKKINKKLKLVDISVEAGNFVANGLIVHNSSQRFHRITEGLAKEFFRRVAEEMKKIFFEMPKLKGILVGGPIPTKEEFLDEGELVTKLKEKVISIKDLGYVDEHGLDLLVESSHEEIKEQELVKEKKILQRFFETLGKQTELAAYGPEKVKTALKRGAVSILLISKKFDRDEAKEFEKMAENISAEVIVISGDNHEGEQFFSITKGIGALLRFPME